LDRRRKEVQNNGEVLKIRTKNLKKLYLKTNFFANGTLNEIQRYGSNDKLVKPQPGLVHFSAVRNCPLDKK